MNESRRVRIDLTYDGTDFAGWQFQPNQRTVQGCLESALSRIQGAGHVRLHGAGRTDSGAHARAQVAHCEVISRLNDRDLLHALRVMSPLDLRPVGLATVAQGFDSRRDARAKTYRYRLDLSAHADPFAARFALHFPHPFDGDAVATALAGLPGERDWSAYTASSCTKPDRVRNLTVARYESSNEVGWFTFRANGFLTHMVRNLVGTLLDVARGRTPADSMRSIVESRDRGLAGPTAPARGLILWEVHYASTRDADGV